MTMKLNHRPRRVSNRKNGNLRNAPYLCYEVPNPNRKPYLGTIIILLASYGLWSIFSGLMPNSKSGSSGTTTITISQLLSRTVDSCEELMSQTYQLRSYLRNDHIAEYMKTNFQPIQDRASSLRTQILQYENMEQIPGGPTLFITTTLDELKHLQTLMGQIEAEVRRLAKASRKRFDILFATGTQALKNNELIVSSDTLKVLAGWGIYLGPMDYVEPEDAHTYAQGRTFPEVLALLRELARLFEDFIQTRFELDQLLVHHGLPALAESGAVRFEPDQEVPPLVDMEIQNFVKKRLKLQNEIEINSDIYKLFFVLKHPLNEELYAALKSTLTYETDRVEPFLRMRTILNKELDQLTVRVSNLKYTYNKKKY